MKCFKNKNNTYNITIRGMKETKVTYGKMISLGEHPLDDRIMFEKFPCIVSHEDLQYVQVHEEDYEIVTANLVFHLTNGEIRLWFDESPGFNLTYWLLSDDEQQLGELAMQILDIDCVGEIDKFYNLERFTPVDF